MLYQLIGIRGPQSGRVFAIGPGQTLWLGRTPEATVPIASTLASRRHAEIRVESGGATVRDLGSANGTRVNGQRVATRPLGPGDVIEIGDEAFRFAWAAAESGVGPSRGQIVVLRGPLGGRSFGLGTATISFGRAPDCTVIVQSQRASRRHAEIRFEAAGVVLHDLKSGNGTVVNGRRIETHPLMHGDVIEIGDEAFRYDATPSSTRMRVSSVASSSPLMDGVRPTLPTIDASGGWDGRRTERLDPNAVGAGGTGPFAAQAVTAPIVPPVAPPAAPAPYAPGAHGPAAYAPTAPGNPPTPYAPAPYVGAPNAAPAGPAAAPAPYAGSPNPPPAAPAGTAPGPGGTGDLKLGIRCPRCRRVVDARFSDCPWDGAALVNGKSVL